MKHFFGRIAILGLAIGFLCVMADAALANGANPVRPAGSRSQENQVSVGVCNPGVTPFPGFSSEEWVGQGNALHLGLFVEQFCVVVTNVVSPSNPFVLELAGHGSVTAANGDVAFIEIDSVLTNVDAGCLATGTLRFVGGTGRFEQASGSMNCQSVHTTPCGPSQTTTCVGTVSY